MKLEEAKRVVSKIKNGRMARVSYLTELPMKAEYKKLGYKIFRSVDTTVRFGCDYDNLKNVIKNKKEIPDIDNNTDKKNRTNNYSWVVENKISYNSATEKYYLRVIPMREGSNRSSSYVFEDTTGKRFTLDTCTSLPTEMKEMVLNSYWKKSGEFRDVLNISLENVVSIKSKDLES